MGVFFLRRILMASAVLVTLIGSAFGPHRASAGKRTARSAALAYLGNELQRYQDSTWRWERLMGVPPTLTAGRNLATASYETLVAVRDKWRGFAARARRRAAHPPHESAWLCIHRYEASWRDDGAPYYGGLQMDWGFMSHYGGFLLHAKGAANHWTPLEQMWVAERAYRSGRGFYPWPNTARYCGLI